MTSKYDMHAFPRNEEVYPHDAGLTMRDYFAIHTHTNDIEFGDIKVAADWIGEELPDENNMIEMLEFTFKLEAFIRYKKADEMMRFR